MIYVRAFIVWLIIISAETVHGISRELFLKPAVGDFRARQIAVFTGIIIIFTIAYYTVRWIRAFHASQLMAVGLIWLVLTLSFEILLGRFAAGYSWERILSDYNIIKGGLLPIGLLAMTFIPLAAGKLRKEI